MVILLMKSSSLLLFLLILASLIVLSLSKADTCSGRWQIIDKTNVKITLDWQILPKTNTIVTEFRTNHLAKGFWHGFSFSSSPDKPTNGLVYALRWRNNDTEIFWDIYNITKSDIIRFEQNDTSLITFQRLLSSGLLTVRPTVNLMSWQCWYFVYMRGRWQNDEPLLPEEIRFNRSLCLTCQQKTQVSSTYATSTVPDTTTITTVDRMNDSTSQSINVWRALNEDVLISTFPQPASSYYRTEYRFIWFGRILNRAWLNDYSDLNSLSSRNLRLDLQNLFLFLINHNSSFSFICNQFEFYSLQSGSILFASNITLISNLSEEQTIKTIEKLIKPVNHSIDYDLYFDRSAHHIIQAKDLSHIDILFKNLSHTIENVYPKRAQTDPTLYLLIGSIIGIGCLMIIITTMLCLYGYYKCRRRQFRLYTQRQTFRFKHDIDSYRWLGQHRSTSSSSPYLIQSTSI